MTQAISQEEGSKQKHNQNAIKKGLWIAKAKRVRHSDVNRKIWLVGSGNPRTPKRFYCVMWDEKLEAFLCECPDFQYNCSIGDLCAHICACGFHDGGE